MSNNDNITAAHVMSQAMAYGLMVDECARMPQSHPHRASLIAAWQEKYDSERAIAERLFGIDRTKMDEFEREVLDVFDRIGLPLD